MRKFNPAFNDEHNLLVRAAPCCDHLPGLLHEADAARQLPCAGLARAAFCGTKAEASWATVVVCSWCVVQATPPPPQFKEMCVACNPQPRPKGGERGPRAASRRDLQNTPGTHWEKSNVVQVGKHDHTLHSVGR